MAKKKVLVTGAGGLVGSIVRQFLGKKYDLSGLDLMTVEGVESHVGDLAVFESIRPAFTGVDTVIHLGADARGQAPWESVLRNNINGTYNVMEASREAGVSRVVFASTNHVAGYHPEKEEPHKSVFQERFGDIRQPMDLLTTDLVSPCCYYAVSKALGENLGSYYHDRHGISFIGLRIGGVVKEEGWQRNSGAGLAMYLSNRDAAQLIERSIDAPISVGYAIVYGISNNTLKVHEIESAEKILGYQPQDNAGIELNPDKGPPVPYLPQAHPEHD